MKKTIISLFLLLCSVGMNAEGTRVVNNGQPFSFWYWMYGAVTKPAIRADLEGMKRVGLRGTYLMPIRGVDEKPEYGGQARQLSPEFWDVVEYAMHCADSLGLELGVHICDGFALAGGPWFTPEESMQKIVYTDTIVRIAEPQKLNRRMRRGMAKATVFEPLVMLQAAKGSKDIAAYAIPVDYNRTEVAPLKLTKSASILPDEKNLVRANEPCWFTFEFEEGVRIRNVEITPAGTNI